MSEILVKADEVALNRVALAAIAAQNFLPAHSGATALGPLGVSWRTDARITVPRVELEEPNIIHLLGGDLNYGMTLNLTIDLNTVLPRLCLPQVCIPTPFGKICSPKVCINWPTISIPVDSIPRVGVSFDAALALEIVDGGDEWKVDIAAKSLDPQLNLTAAAIVGASLAAISAAISTIPFIGPILGLAVAIFTALFLTLNLVGMLHLIVDPFIKNLRLTLYRRPKILQLMPYSSPLDPAVALSVLRPEALVQGDFFVLSADVAPLPA